MSSPNKQDKPQPKRKYYFWKYDLFPFLLGEPGVRQPNGSVETENFGKGYHFSPRYEFSLKDGRRFHAELRRLEAERDKAMQDVNDLYKQKLAELTSSAWVIEGVVLR